MASLQILNSQFRDRKILVLHEDPNHLERLITSFEQDPEWAGLDLYGASQLDEARRLTRAHSIDLAIFPQEMGGKDFVTIQQELKKAHPNIQMIPLLSVPTIAQLRESRRAGGVVDYGDLQSLSDPIKLKILLQGFFRELSGTQLGGHKKLLEHTSGIQRALLIDHQDWVSIKKVSSGLIGAVTSHFDVTPTEASLILGAETIYVPWLASSSYAALLGNDSFHLGPILNATGTWLDKPKKPTSIAGLIVTATNFIADALAARKTREEIQDLIGKRPEALKHVAIRTLGPDAVAHILGRATELKQISQRAG